MNEPQAYVLNTSISSRAIGKRGWEKCSPKQDLEMRNLMRQSQLTILLLERLGEKEDVLSNLFSDSFSFFIINDLAHGFSVVSLRAIVPLPPK